MHESICDFLLDIIQNAVEADAAVVTVHVQDTSETVSCRVTDDGKGMDESELERIRDPFYTDGVKHSHRKVGLGIPFLEQAVDQAGGIMSITSVKGSGTEIYFSFPAGHIDTPPMGDTASTFFAAMTYPGDSEMHIDYSIVRDSTSDGYELHRGELIEILGDLTMSQSLLLLRDYIQSQDDGLGIDRKDR